MGSSKPATSSSFLKLRSRFLPKISIFYSASSTFSAPFTRISPIVRRKTALPALSPMTPPPQTACARSCTVTQKMWSTFSADFSGPTGRSGRWIMPAIVPKKRRDGISLCANATICCTPMPFRRARLRAIAFCASSTTSIRRRHVTGSRPRPSMCSSIRCALAN